MGNKEKVQKILEASKKVFIDAAVENGGIVAGNTDMSYYPPGAKNYHYVWPRDGAYVCVAADMLGVDIAKPFFKWMYERPEKFEKTGLLYRRYATNGRLEGEDFQPDQHGALLWAIAEHVKNTDDTADEYKDLIVRLAEGLSEHWRGHFFDINTVDLWEEEKRQTLEEYENTFTYSLAACSRGLLLADFLFPHKTWRNVATEMKEQMEKAYDKEHKYFLRTKGKINDYNVDASLVGLVYPFDMIEATNAKMVNTVSQIEKKIVHEGGVHRFEMDYYDGEGRGWEGAGAWPLLNFWLSIYYAKKGDTEKAEDYFDWVIDKMKDDYIPEQMFSDGRVGVKPLVWSHAMFVIACSFLGYLEHEG
ncbi:hypothetical protein KKH43_05385 [Patescibacteria group bacterium]|nr:hypothetical protein [Patescibacteria group bacterium]